MILQQYRLDFAVTARIVLAASLLFAAGPGCSSDFDPPSKLDSLRILALQAEPPEARPGEAVSLSALVYVPASRGGAEAAAFSWRACFLASDSSALAAINVSPVPSPNDERPMASCFDLPESMTMAELLGRLQRGEQLPDLGSTAIELGEEAQAELAVPPLPAFPAFPSTCRELDDGERLDRGGREIWLTGLRLTVSLRTSDEVETVTANKRLVLRPDPADIAEAEQGNPFRVPRLCSSQEAGDDEEAGPVLCARNENPLPPAIEAPNGEWPGQGPIRVAPGAKIKLRTLPPAEGELQSFVALKTCGLQAVDEGLQRTGGEYARQEGRYYAWYADGGEILADETVLGEKEGDMDSAWQAPDEEGGPYTLHLVVRDGRGGMAWASWQLEVVKP